MISDEDLTPRPKAARKLEEMGVQELNDRIAMLQAEIEACKAMLQRKGAGRAAAESLFSKKD